MSIWRWVTGRLDVRNYYPWKIIFGSDEDSGERVTPETALKLSAWWACTRLISETIATLPIGVFQKNGDGDAEPMRNHPLYRLLHDEPNDWQTPVEFWEGRIAPLCTVGNSYAEKRSVGDRLVLLHPLPDGSCSPFFDEKDGYRVKYRVNDRGKSEILPASKIFHIRGFGIDEIEGLSPVGAASRTIGTALAAERASARLFGKGLRAAGFFKPPVDMDKTQREQFIKNYVTPGESVQNEGRALVMPPGFEWENFGITPKDAELIASRGVSIEDVCRFMGVPPILIGHAQSGQTMWGSGVEQIILGWLVLGLRAYLKRIEAAVNMRLMTPADRANGIYFEFNFEGLLRADSAGRAALMASLAQNGLRNRDELRKLDNMPALPDGQGQKFTVQSNLVELDQLGAVAANLAAEQVRNALKNWLAEERKAA